jgi:endonuclease V-like protein UPF0215 family/signal peptidase I
MPLGGLKWRNELESDSKKFRKVKDEVQVLGIDDAPFKSWDKEVKIVAALFRGPRILDGVFHTQIEKDGLDVTDKVIQLVTDIKRENVRAILLDGVTFGGFNIIDIQRVYKETGIPVIVAMQKRPDFAKIKAALRNLDRIEKRKTLIEAAGPIHAVEFDGKRVYIQKAGIELEDAQEVIKKLTINGLVPEPLRAAHLIGKGAYQEMGEKEESVGIHKQVYNFVKEKKEQVERAKHKYLPGVIGEIFTFLFALLLAWLFIQGMGILLNTSSPLVVVESESMQHPSNWKDWHLLNGLEPSTYGFQGGMGVGDIIIVKGDGLKDINVGDVIVYQKLDCNSNSGGEPIIHRVIGTADVSGEGVQTTGAVTYADGLIKTPCDKSRGYALQEIKDRYSNAAVFKGYNTENFRLFFTKGDNNRQEDQCNSSCLSYPIHEKLVVGRAKFDIPYLGYVKLGLVCVWNYATGNACSSHCWWPANHPRCSNG